MIKKKYEKKKKKNKKKKKKFYLELFYFELIFLERSGESVDFRLQMRNLLVTLQKRVFLLKQYTASLFIIAFSLLKRILKFLKRRKLFFKRFFQRNNLIRKILVLFL